MGRKLRPPISLGGGGGAWSGVHLREGFWGSYEPVGPCAEHVVRDAGGGDVHPVEVEVRGVGGVERVRRPVGGERLGPCGGGEHE